LDQLWISSQSNEGEFMTHAIRKCTFTHSPVYVHLGYEKRFNLKDKKPEATGIQFKSVYKSLSTWWDILLSYISMKVIWAAAAPFHFTFILFLFFKTRCNAMFFSKQICLDFVQKDQPGKVILLLNLLGLLKYKVELVSTKHCSVRMLSVTKTTLARW